MATAVAIFKPPAVETPQAAGVWTETSENLLLSLPDWKPLKEISQEYLDQTLGQACDPLPQRRGDKKGSWRGPWWPKGFPPN